MHWFNERGMNKTTFKNRNAKCVHCREWKDKGSWERIRDLMVFSVHSPATVQDWRNMWLMLQTNAIFRSNRVCHLSPLRFCLSGESLTVWMIFWSKKGITPLSTSFGWFTFPPLIQFYSLSWFQKFAEKLMFWIWLTPFFLMFSPSRHLHIVSSVLTKWHCPMDTSSWKMSSSGSPNQ